MRSSFSTIFSSYHIFINFGFSHFDLYYLYSSTKEGMPMFGEKLDPAVLRKTIEEAQQAMPEEPGVVFEALKFGEMDAEKAVSQNYQDDAVIIYMHGGGLVCGNAYTSRGYSGVLASEAGYPVYAFSYRLAPEDPYPAAINDCFEAYKEIIKIHSGKPVFLIGESGGAYLSLTTALMAKEAKIPMPSGVIPYSPVMDFSGKIDRSRNADKDITVTPEGMITLRDLYCPQESAWKDPLVSPVYADYRNFPATMIVWDRDETLAPDAEILVEMLEAEGVKVSYKSYEGCFHAFPTTGKGTPESYEVLKDTVRFMHEQVELFNN
jgi:acetyl esterase/lipase